MKTSWNTNKFANVFNVIIACAYHALYLTLLLSFWCHVDIWPTRVNQAYKPLKKLRDVFKSSLLFAYYLIIITVGKTGNHLALQEILMELIWSSRFMNGNVWQMYLCIQIWILINVQQIYHNHFSLTSLSNHPSNNNRKFL